MTPKASGALRRPVGGLFRFFSEKNAREIKQSVSLTSKKRNAL